MLERQGELRKLCPRVVIGVDREANEKTRGSYHVQVGNGRVALSHTNRMSQQRCVLRLGTWIRLYMSSYSQDSIIVNHAIVSASRNHAQHSY